jgi:hypothetical protein
MARKVGRIIMVVLLAAVIVALTALSSQRATMERGVDRYYGALWGASKNPPSKDDVRDVLYHIERKHPGYLAAVAQCAIASDDYVFWSCVDELEWR